MKKNIIALLLAASGLVSSCKEDFLDRPSQNGPTLDTYYTTAAQVNAATGLLYNTIWYEWQDKAYHAIGEVLSGNMYTGDPKYNSFANFTVQSTDEQVSRSWYAFYKVAGNATVLIQTFEQKKTQVADPSFLTQGVAEARFMRGMAYFYLARVFGDVPIISDPVALANSGDYKVPRYLQKDVLRFVVEDLQYAEQYLPDASYQAGRVTKHAAKGMLSKVYLYMKDYANAKAKATEVMSSQKYSLVSDYGAMFTSSKMNNNPESLVALQWLAAGGYSIGNPIQAYVGPAPLLKPTTGAGWSAIIPSIDVLNSYESGDKRRRWSVMEHGFTRTDWTNVNFPNGFKYDTTWTSSTDDATKIKTPTRSNALKYIVGPGSNGENVNGTSTDICTYLLRYADVLLIYAEATIGTGTSTTDASALEAFNKVHTRAGLSPVTSLTKDQLLKERRVEFAFEGDYWFDIQRQGFDKAKQMLASQERGTYNGNGTINSMRVSISSASQLYLPVPQAETVSNPKLLEPAIPYYK
ncbi:RagB/SusD family nutrient uptake outer membrane protein [Flectobacillus longus]|uniref:RagB/SusD family nutrient uptake outer membrane protein n=1 Tax=Flectobacillus longus TaxID=2984207 RepID=UPI0024B65982|nr:RagB/SusD family nutrient uptake outer membrane protein [Flectobacillus longus]MDI9878048.1 RagB/SusD family nutrient uptake outer membrane protein [Flectobacillus longus]